MHLILSKNILKTGLTDNDGMPCENPCPVPCGENETFCEGEFDPNGCQMANTCLPPTPGKVKKEHF